MERKVAGKGVSLHRQPCTTAASARDDEEADEDLGEAGDEWMAEQGFDSVER